METKLITLKTNHTLIGQVSISNDVVSIKQPVQVFVQPTKDGMQMGFGPFLDFSEDHATGIHISMEDVLCVTTPVVDLMNQYNKLFGSGITIASSIPKF